MTRPIAASAPWPPPSGSPETGEAVSLCIAYPLSTVAAEEREDIIARLLAGAREVAALAGDPNWQAGISASAA